MNVERRLDEIERRLRWVEDTRRTFDRRRTALWQGVRDLESAFAVTGTGGTVDHVVEGTIFGCDGTGLAGAYVTVEIVADNGMGTASGSATTDGSGNYSATLTFAYGSYGFGSVVSSSVEVSKSRFNLTTFTDAIDDLNTIEAGFGVGTGYSPSTGVDLDMSGSVATGFHGTDQFPDPLAEDLDLTDPDFGTYTVSWTSAQVWASGNVLGDYGGNGGSCPVVDGITLSYTFDFAIATIGGTVVNSRASGACPDIGGNTTSHSDTGFTPVTGPMGADVTFGTSNLYPSGVTLEIRDTV